MSNPDQIQRILFDQIDVRGVVAGLENSYQEVLSRHDYPLVLQRLLGEMLAAVSMLSSTLKFEGRLLLQAQGEGAVRLLMAECNHHQDLRAIARYEGEVADDLAFNELLVKGRIALTIEPEKGQRYQGVVPLEHSTLAQCLQAYFEQSEQLGTSIHLAADGQRAAGLMLQVLPAEGTGDEDWSRVSMLASTLKDDELLQLDNEELLFRLFHEETCRLYEPQSLRFQCDCSRERSAEALKFMTEDELLDILAEQNGSIDVGCQFCNQQYHFDETDIRALFSEPGYLDQDGRMH
ncbi:Hsp33 family molecular chaperone HslO [Marinobacterium sediminicola]|uniref:33 kDa chaperonin n=1 Tax=Marinobacterium sediminicola TaxID=518898 RepID=A0ABY1S1P3_9GAMM|nr:Hsp33 family molecular chaperone HslO [Marinobacterium sediminicola]ULG69359.1 Hsp33 family molecular chaperone HslO [Marinobacterium sediminicola]SMR75506.1 molecular chaperone Hsp33 [Marinobacterium sediminicola]